MRALGLALLLTMKAGSTGVRLDDAKKPLAERVKSARELGKAKARDPKAISALLRGLEGPGEDLRKAAVESLKALDATPVLVARSADKKTPLNERREAVKALRCLADPRAYEALKTLLGSEHEVLRREAAFALTTGGAAEAEAELVKLLADPSAEVRYFAVVALGGLKGETAAQALEKHRAVEQDFTVKDALMQAASRQQR